MYLSYNRKYRVKVSYLSVSNENFPISLFRSIHIFVNHCCQIYWTVHSLINGICAEFESNINAKLQECFAPIRAFFELYTGNSFSFITRSIVYFKRAELISQTETRQNVRVGKANMTSRDQISIPKEIHGAGTTCFTS